LNNVLVTSCKEFKLGPDEIFMFIAILVQNILKLFKDRKATIVAMSLFSHNLPTDRARELLKPSSDSGSLLVSIKKIGKFWI